MLHFYLLALFVLCLLITTIGNYASVTRGKTFIKLQYLNKLYIKPTVIFKQNFENLLNCTNN